jgi:hypothetical protein
LILLLGLPYEGERQEANPKLVSVAKVDKNIKTIKRTLFASLAN